MQILWQGNESQAKTAQGERDKKQHLLRFRCRATAFLRFFTCKATLLNYRRGGQKETRGGQNDSD